MTHLSLSPSPLTSSHTTLLVTVVLIILTLLPSLLLRAIDVVKVWNIQFFSFSQDNTYLHGTHRSGVEAVAQHTTHLPLIVDVIQFQWPATEQKRDGTCLA